MALATSDFFLRLAVHMCEDLSSIKTIKYSIMAPQDMNAEQKITFTGKEIIQPLAE